MGVIDPFFWKQPVHHKHLVLFLLLLVTIFLTIVVAGGSSGASKGLYLLHFEYSTSLQQNYKPWTGLANTDLADAQGIVSPNTLSALLQYSENSTVSVRLGYFGVCALTNKTKNSSALEWECGRNISRIASHVPSETLDSLNTIYLANKVRTSAFSPWILLLSICLVVCAFGLLVVAHHVATAVFTGSVALTTLSFVLTMTGMVWQQCSVKTAQTATVALSQTVLIAKQGSPLAGLGWTSVFLLFCCALCLGHMFISSRTADDIEPELPVIGPGHGRVLSHSGGSIASEVESLAEDLVEKMAKTRLK